MNFGVFVPQVFYDLIARVGPGLVLLLAIYLVGPGSDAGMPRWDALIGKLTGPGAVWPFVLGASIVAYMLSTFLEGLWHWRELTQPIQDRNQKSEPSQSSPEGSKLAQPIQDNNQKSEPSHSAPEGSKPAASEAAATDIAQPAISSRWKSFSSSILQVPLPEPRIIDVEKHVLSKWEDFPNSKTKIAKFPSTALMYDDIRTQNPVAGACIVKLRAEVHAYQRLIAGWLLCLAITIANSPYKEWSFTVIAIMMFLALWAASVLLYLWREEQCHWSLCNHWLLSRITTVQLRADGNFA